MEFMLEPGIFRHPRPKKSTFPPLNKKRKIEHKIEEVSFDFTSREEYLTGFHKRKVARAKAAQAEAAKKSREERILQRKKLRDDRKKELQSHVDAINMVLKGLNESTNDDNDENRVLVDGSAFAPVSVDQENEYIDDERFTTVTIEEVDVSKNGLSKVVDPGKDSEGEMDSTTVAEVTSDGKKRWIRKPKKKFRYESKTERKVNMAKQRASKRKLADARKMSD